MFSVFGVGFIYLTRLFEKGAGWNVFFWTNLIIGNGLLMLMYSREYYAYFSIHNPERLGIDEAVIHAIAGQKNFVYDTEGKRFPTWMPYSWQPFAQPFYTNGNGTIAV